MKGLGTFIAAVMLVAIVLVVSLVVLNWSSSLAQDQGKEITNRSSCNLASVTIEEVYVDFATNRSRITVRNGGLVDDKLASGSVLSKTGDSAPNLTVFPIDFPRGSLKTIEFNVSGKIVGCENFSRALVATQCGVGDKHERVRCS